MIQQAVLFQNHRTNFLRSALSRKSFQSFRRLFAERLFASLLLIFVSFSFSPHACAQNESEILKVYWLAGQSNMEGQGVVDLNHPEHYNGGKGTLNQMWQDSEKQPLLSHTRDNGKWFTRDDVFVRFQTSDELKTGGLSVGFTGYEGKHHIGPEFQFGHRVGEATDEKILLIKTAWGGKSLLKDFRPPSSGGEVGPYYQKMFAEYHEALAKIESEFPELATLQPQLCGFVWFQGWNDYCDENGRKEYATNLANLIRDVRADLSIPHLPFVVGELGNMGEEVDERMVQFRASQDLGSAAGEFAGNVGYVTTKQFARPKDESPNVTHGHHWFGNAESYFLIGDAFANKMLELESNQTKKRILILGDSISIGYGPTVAKELNDIAWTVRPMNLKRRPENCAGTNRGIERIDDWLQIGGGKWDVIHFNFGLHDLKHVDPQTGQNSQDPNHPEQAPPERYESQLREITDKLRVTGAKLIFCTTTPVPTGGVKPFRDPNAPELYNNIAKQIMSEYKIEVNDLFMAANEKLDEIQQPVNVHFSHEGSKYLGKIVAERIRRAINE